MAILHCVCGPVAAGKSTYSARLAAENNAIVFSIDNWIKSLFGDDIPTGGGPIDFAWFSQRVDRCEEQSWQVVEQLLKQDVNVVFDWGFIRRERRDKVNSRAVQQGHQVQWHIVESDQAERRNRVAERNANRGETFVFAVTPAMFEFAESLYEPPQDDELPTAVRYQS